METTSLGLKSLWGLYRGYIRGYVGDNGRENGNYYQGFRVWRFRA